MKDKIVITIGRQFGSGGREIGKLIAEKLGINFYDKELISIAAKQSGLCEQIFETHDEKPTSSFLYSLVMDTYSLGYGGTGYMDVPVGQKVFLAQFDAIKKIAENESCVIVGRCADYALEEYRNVFNVFVHADRDARIKRVMENSLKEYAKVNGNIVTKQDVESYFKDLGLDDSKYQMITGYLLANDITVKGENGVDNEFLNMLEKSAVKQTEELEEEVAEETVFVTDEDYEKDEKYIQMYMEDLKDVEELSDTGRAFLLMNIVEDNDKESLSLLSQSFLKKIVGWIEPFRRKGVLASDLIQEANLAMMAYIGEKHFLNNYEWKDKIKEGNTQDLINVLEEIEKEVKSEIEGSLRMMIDEQNMSNKAAVKVLGKVNLVNDWAKRLKEELERKPTVDELAEKMGISKENVMEAIRLSAENIEDIDIRA